VRNTKDTMGGHLDFAVALGANGRGIALLIDLAAAMDPRLEGG
jgi:hypothetical protein